MITDSIEIFCDKYHKRQHLSDDLIKYIMNMNTLQIREEQKEKHKQLFMNDFIKDGNFDTYTENEYSHNNIIVYMLRDRRLDKSYNCDVWMFHKWEKYVQRGYEDSNGISYEYLPYFTFDYSK
mgnify:CR=1 FL=1